MKLLLLMQPRHKTLMFLLTLFVRIDGLMPNTWGG